MFGLFTKERKDPADIAKEFTENMGKEDQASKEPEDKEAEKPADENKDEKPTQPGSESSPEAEAVKQEAEKKAAEQAEKDKDPKRNLGAEKRINDLVAELKALKSDYGSKDREYSKRIEYLEKEKDELQVKAGIAPENKAHEEVAVLEKNRIKTYLEEDKELPREQRREMSKDEFEDWLLEDMTTATDWRVEQTIRRREERAGDTQKLSARTEVDKILKAQTIAKLRVEARHPELDLDAESDKLRAEGMDDKAIHAKFYAENIKYKTVVDIIKSDKELAQKVLLDPNGPELLEKEMVKRLAEAVNKPPEKEPEGEKLSELEQQIAELQEELDIEKGRKARVDAGIISKKGASKVSKIDNSKPNPELDKALSLLNKMGKPMSRQDYSDMVERRRGIRGADTHVKETDD